MGIPYYFYTLTKSYHDIITYQKPSASIGTYCMDFNGIIHPICAKHIAKDFNEDKVIEDLYQKVLADIATLKPKHTLVCIDGVVPLAKMIQQRKRRYLSVYKNKIDKVDVKWDTNAITPGTQFMKKIDAYFTKHLNDSKIIFSGSNEYGEGEHKIFKMLDQLQYQSETDDIIIINGLDADLIILSLMSHKRNIYLMRENETTMYLNIDKLRDAILNELRMKWSLSDQENTQDIIESYCVMCSLLGNDFIPHLLTLNLRGNGLDRLISYTGQAYKMYGLLVYDSQINYACLSDILEHIAKSEQEDMHRETSKYIKHPCPQGSLGQHTPSEYYALRNKEDIASAIYSNINNWRQIYYKKLFHTNINIDSTVVASACQEYIKGIYWTYAYYKKKNYDKLWYYPFTYPPSVRDIANYMLGNVSNVNICDDVDNTQVVLDANIQLLIVLPRESHHLLDPKYQNITVLQHLYPTTYKIHTFLKTHLWECMPDLPVINVAHIMNTI